MRVGRDFVSVEMEEFAANLNVAGLLTFTSQPRGLVNFISDIRHVKSKDDERKRIDKELGNIRLKFSQGSTLTSYQKKKYVWKMCYIYMLGYDIDFGHAEFISIIGSQKYQDKAVGYMAIAMMIKPGDELLTLVINSMRADLNSNNNPAQCLALAVVANLGGVDLAESLGTDVERILLDKDEKPYAYQGSSPEKVLQDKYFLRKKAALCLLHLFRTHPEKDVVDLNAWEGHLEIMLQDNDIGFVNSCMSLALEFAKEDSAQYESLVGSVIYILDRLVNVARGVSPDYLYYRIACPWLQVKCLQFLQLYSFPNDNKLAQMLTTALQAVLMRDAESAESNNAGNTINSILFEAVDLIINYGPDASAQLHEMAVNWFGQFIEVKDANTRYLGLDAMIKFVKQHGPAELRDHLFAVIAALKDSDISIQKKALELLYVMTDTTNAESTVAELCNFLDEVDSVMKEDMVIKIALLTENHAKGSQHQMQWYIDTILKVLLGAGDYTSENVWHRVVHLVTNTQQLQEYAAEKFMCAMQQKYVHEVAVAVGAYILGEFGFNICEKSGMTGYDQFAALHQHFALCSLKVQQILLTTYVKFSNLYPDTREFINDFFTKTAESPYVELQQRACEYLQLSSTGAQMVEEVLKEMPNYPENMKNKLLEEAMKVATPAGGAIASSTTSRPTARVNSSISSGNNTSPSHTSKHVDLLSLDDDYHAPLQAPDSPSSKLTPLSPDQAAQMVRNHNAILAASPGQIMVLFEDGNITINYVGQFVNHQGRLSFQLINKAPTPINDLTSVTQSTDMLRVTQQGPSPSVAVGTTDRLQLSIDCMRPFEEPLMLKLSYSCGGSPLITYNIPLPVKVTSFFSPIVLDKNVFMERWKLMSGPDEEIQETFSSKRSIDADFMQNLRASVLPALNVGLATDIDSATTATGSSTFKTGTMGPDGVTPIIVGAMMRLEADVASSRIRITVHSKNKSVGAGLVSTVKAVLG